jgi:hypothetical protein
LLAIIIHKNGPHFCQSINIWGNHLTFPITIKERLQVVHGDKKYVWPGLLGKQVDIKKGNTDSSELEKYFCHKVNFGDG